MIGQAPTGTGKTLGSRRTTAGAGQVGRRRRRRAPQALVVVPTRELGLQVARDIAGSRADPGHPGYCRSTVAVAYEKQTEALTTGCGDRRR